jgi:dTDP-4-dehydrorhamnose 3,5-epimerase
MKTVAHKNLESWWGGKVIIDEVREYCDPRGSLTELWRKDDEVMNEPNNVNPVMSYWSITKPFIMRGPHQHEAQTDWFYTFKSKMLYQLYNPETKEMKTFITNKNAITRVKVAPPIIHSYRSLESSDILTANFPTALFMGENKKSKIDETRWEEKFEHNPKIIIFGANGRLGKKLTKAFLNGMGFHEYDVIPCYDKIESKGALDAFLLKLEALYKEKNVYFFNCAALTNVQDVNTTYMDWEWANSVMPIHIANVCRANGWKFIGLSTDYVYKELDTNNYTNSKKQFEKTLSVLKEDSAISILRVANLYSLDLDDSHNAIVKMRNRIQQVGSITIDPNLSIFPTNVEHLSNTIVEMYKNKEFEAKELKYFNIVTKEYKLDDFVERFITTDKSKIELKDSGITPWATPFKEDPTAKIIHLREDETFIEEIASRK